MIIRKKVRIVLPFVTFVLWPRAVFAFHTPVHLVV